MRHDPRIAPTAGAAPPAAPTRAAWLLCLAACAGGDDLAATQHMQGPTRPPTPARPLIHDAFLWQRRWTPEVYAALQQAPAGLRRTLMLAAEVEWRGPDPQIVQTGLDWAWLARDAPAHACGLAIRVGLPGPLPAAGPAASPAAPDALPDPLQDRLRRAALAALAAVRAKAEANRFSPCELHLDLDMPTARLAGYAAWLPDARAAWPGPPLTVTGLPDWLRPEARPGLLAALAQVDGWVLQVHWLRDTAAPGDPPRPALMEESEARRAVALAAALPAPFRVALPTYTQQTRHGEARPDPALLLRLLGEWSTAPPALEGAIWFRLPVPGDPAALPAPALAALIAGRPPIRAAAAEAAPAAPGLWDLALRNTGEDALPAACLTALLPTAGTPALVGALHGDPAPIPGGWQIPAATGDPLAPGARRIVGWLRAAPDSPPRVSAAPDACPPAP